MKYISVLGQELNNSDDYLNNQMYINLDRYDGFRIYYWFGGGNKFCAVSIDIYRGEKMCTFNSFRVATVKSDLSKDAMERYAKDYISTLESEILS
jgi:hypothetical protein